MNVVVPDGFAWWRHRVLTSEKGAHRWLAVARARRARDSQVNASLAVRSTGLGVRSSSSESEVATARLTLMVRVERKD